VANSNTVLRVDVTEDLLPLSAVLHQRAVIHRIYEEAGYQVLTVENRSQVDEVLALYRAWRAGDLIIESVPKPTTGPTSRPVMAWRSAPVTLLLIVLSFGGFSLIYFNAPMAWVSMLTFSAFEVIGGQIRFFASDGEYWRLITPAFIHFGWIHIAFNSMWLWDLGGRVESVMGRVNMLLLFLTIALVSNVSQFVFGGPSLFGGMSGVVYGLLGFSWVGPLLQPHWAIQPARPIMLFMIGWLVVCMLGVVDLLGFGAIANAAHLGGLICGAVLGAAFGLLSVSTQDKG
jgi:GlpG protein